MKKGEIYFGQNNRVGKHPMVFLSDIDGDTFNGLMLTHSSIHNNLKLENHHFEWTAKGFDTENTHVVRRSLIKRREWEPFTLVGQLSIDGIVLVEELIEGQDPEFF